MTYSYSVDQSRARAAATESAASVSAHKIPALDGLRFMAAFSVMVAHGYWYIVLLQQQDAIVGIPVRLLGSLAGIGMTLFFVLSGFVIHLNYHKTVPSGARGRLSFFIARFARLYPLFLAVFLFDFVRLISEQGYFTGYVLKSYDAFKALPLYLTFTQTWWWWPLGPTSAYEYYATPTTGATGAMWSLSTEAFFYFAYMFFAGALTRMSGWRLAALAVAIAVGGLAFYLIGFGHTGDLRVWAAAYSPDTPPDQFDHWLLFQSPWGRISEFLLGAVAAQAYLTGKPGPRPHAAWLTYGSLAAFLIPVLIVHGEGSPRALVMPQCCAAALAVSIYAVARHRTAASRFMSQPILVKLGDASYSLYLLHYFVLHDWGRNFVFTHPAVPRLSVLLALMLVSLLISLLSYQYFEKPAKSLVRECFRPLRLDIWLPAMIALTTAFCVLVSVHMRALANSDPSPGSGRIAISSASFGDNCNPSLRNNVLGLMRRVCGAQQTCTFDYDVARLGDPAGGCNKRLQVLYSCGPSLGEREFLIPSFDRARMLVEFSCK